MLIQGDYRITIALPDGRLVGQLWLDADELDSVGEKIAAEIEAWEARRQRIIH